MGNDAKARTESRGLQPPWKWAARIDASIACGAVSLLDGPHVVYVWDRVLEVPSVLGPFPDGLSAVVYAERFPFEVTGIDGISEERAGMRVSVIPLEASHVSPFIPSRRGRLWLRSRRWIGAARRGLKHSSSK